MVTGAPLCRPIARAFRPRVCGELRKHSESPSVWPASSFPNATATVSLVLDGSARAPSGHEGFPRRSVTGRWRGGGQRCRAW